MEVKASVGLLTTEAGSTGDVWARLLHAARTKREETRIRYDESKKFLFSLKGMDFTISAFA